MDAVGGLTRDPGVGGLGKVRWDVPPPSSSGLGHRPFKAAARVRIPLGVLPHHAASEVLFGARRSLVEPWLPPLSRVYRAVVAKPPSLRVASDRTLQRGSS
jgi:hypothetical protein